MKKLLLLLLCVPLIGVGQEEGCVSGDCENGYGTEVSEYGGSGSTAKYVGDFKNGRYHGKGTLLITAETYTTNYVGEFRYGKKHGNGTYTNVDGDKYVGEYKDGRQHGKGEYTYVNGDKWIGEFINGFRMKGSWVFPNGVEIGECLSGDCINGKGTYIFTRGEYSNSKYEGEFIDGKMNGNGALYNKFNFRYYQGEFKDGEMDGQGKQFVSDGKIRYEGEWKNDRYHGQGTNNEYTRSGYLFLSYEGEWKYGAKHGQGTYKYYEELYVGEFKDDKEHGRGIKTYDEIHCCHKTYDGEWKYGKRDGIGTLTYKSGRTHVGEFKDGSAQGRGITTYSDGSKEVGVFGDEKNTTSIDKDGNEKKFEMFGEGFTEFLDEMILELQIEESAEWNGNGSGIILTESGYIVTNYHVIQNTTEIQVSCNINDEVQRFNAEIVKVDEKNDLAIIKIKDDNFKELDELPYNFQTKIRDKGTTVYAYGYPMSSIMGKEIKVTNGMISSTTGILGDETTYLHTAPIQSGNSGGPLFDDRGNFIGINSFGIKEEVAKTDNVAYAIKSKYVQDLTHFIPELFLELPKDNKLESLSLVEQIKEISKYVVLIRIK